MDTAEVYMVIVTYQDGTVFYVPGHGYDGAMGIRRAIRDMSPPGSLVSVFVRDPDGGYL